MIKDNLLADVIEIAHDAIKSLSVTDPKETQGARSYIDAATIDHLDDVSKLAVKRSQYATVKNQQERNNIVIHGFGDIINKVGERSDSEINHLSRLIAVDSIANNAVNSAERAAIYNDPKNEPKAQISKFLVDYFKEESDKATALTRLQEKVESLLISLVDTKHPTIYHTPEASAFEARFSTILEDSTNLMPRRNATDPLRLNDKGKKEVAELFASMPDKSGEDLAAGFMQKLANGKNSITPKRQLTVGIETKAQVGYRKKMEGQLKEVIKAWNAALDTVQVDGLTSEQLKAALSIDEKREKKMVEFRTWGESFDADGRDKSTSRFLSVCIQKNLDDVPPNASPDPDDSVKVHNNKIYNGAIGDLRQNAKEVHLPFISALIQVKTRNSADESRGRSARYSTPEQRESENNGKSFLQFCREFMDEKVDVVTERDDRGDAIKTESKTRAEKYEDLNGNGNGLQWQGPEYSIFQQLDGEDKAKFLTAVIEKNYKFIPEQLRADTLAFNIGGARTLRPEPSPDKGEPLPPELNIKNPDINKLGGFFLKRYAEQIKKAKLDPETITYDQMIKVTIPHDPSKKDGAQVSLRGAFDTMLKLNGWEIVHSGLTYTPLPYGPPEKPVLDFWNYVHPDQILVQNFLMGAKKPGKSDMEDMDERDRSIATDTAKRMFIINDAIDKYGSKVATRYQIANFSEAADFLSLLKLFQDTGIAKIENGKVISSKLAIMPLLETGEDLKNAPVIFKALLDNPLAKSFWQARKTKDAPYGEAEIMLGFSDGAASVGNFASQWEIYKATQSLTQLFAEHDKEHPIKVRFFQGRGRGTDRGGSIDPSLQMDLVSPEAMQRGIYDVTLQSDLPMDLAASDAYGKDYFTKILLGTLQATLKAPGRIELLANENHEEQAKAEQRKKMIEMETDIQWIADRSAEIYQKIVRTDNPEAALAVMNRGSDNKWKTSRAAARGTEKESKVFDKVRAIPKEYKLNGMDLQAHNVGLKQALEEFAQKIDKEAGKGEGDRRLAALNQHPFFSAITQTIRAGLANYDPTIARAHAEAIKLKPYKLEDEGEDVKPQNFVERVIPHLDGLAGQLDWLTGNTDKAFKTRTEGDSSPVTFHKPSWSSVLDQIAHAIIVDGLKNRKKERTPLVGRPDQKEWADTLFNSLFVTAQEVGHRELPWRGQNVGHDMAA